METQATISAILLVIFALLAAIDGIYIHLWKYRLHTRRASRFEHLTHTARAVLFIPIVWSLYGHASTGALLWFGVAMVVLDLGVELGDMLTERDSRATLGGLSSFEYMLHVALTAIRMSSITLILASRPVAAWSLGASALPDNAFASQIASLILPGAILIAGLHVWTSHPRFIRDAESISLQPASASS